MAMTPAPNATATIGNATAYAMGILQAIVFQMADILDDKGNIDIRQGNGLPLPARLALIAVIALLLHHTFLVAVEGIRSRLAARFWKLHHVRYLQKQWDDHLINEARPWYWRVLYGERLRYTLTKLAEAIRPSSSSAPVTSP